MRDTNLSNIFTLQFWGIFLVVLGHSMPYKDMPFWGNHCLSGFILFICLCSFASLAIFTTEGIPNMKAKEERYFF